jgi:hypothetical protein
MTSLEPTPHPNSDLSIVRRETRRLGEELMRLQIALADARKDSAAAKQAVSALASKLTKLERASQSAGNADDPRPSAIKPVPLNADKPDPREVRRHVLYELYKKGCWSGKHTSGEHLRRGYLQKVERRLVWEVIHQLRSEGLLAAHGKSAEEHFSLNPARANEIYEELGIPPRDTRTEQPESDIEASSDKTDGRNGRSGEGVSKGTFQHTVDSIRDRIEALEAGSSAHAREEFRLETQLRDLLARFETLEVARKSHPEVAPPINLPKEQSESVEGATRARQEDEL